MISKKICLLGAFGVGKTSLVRRYVYNVFSTKYQTTLGVKIDFKAVSGTAGEVKLIIWDVEGSDGHNKVRSSYLRGAQGALFVADLTRPNTLDIAAQLLDSVQRASSTECTTALAFNKADLPIKVESGDVAEANSLFGHSVMTSAQDGTGVDELFRYFATDC